MMELTEVIQAIGLVATLTIFGIDFCIAVNPKWFMKTGRVALSWTAIFVFFLSSLRLFSFLSFGTTQDLRILSVSSSVITLVAILAHLMFWKQAEEGKPVPHL